MRILWDLGQEDGLRAFRSAPTCQTRGVVAQNLPRLNQRTESHSLEERADIKAWIVGSGCHDVYHKVKRISSEERPQARMAKTQGGAQRGLAKKIVPARGPVHMFRGYRSPTQAACTVGRLPDGA